ncbi:MAG: protein kinase [Planctomycetota bacterium]
MFRCSNCGYEADAPFRFCPECGLQQVESAKDPLVGRSLGGRYRVLERIGEGSTGLVYRAEHVSLKRPVAVKILHRDLQVNAETLSRFQREGMIVSQFAHPNAIQIFDLDRDEDGLLFLAMELVVGTSLKEVLQEEGALDPDLAVDLMRQLLSVLDAAHSQGIIHRDLKPENLMIARDEDTRTMKVLDFGLSKLVDRPAGASLMTMTGHVMGTPLYMSPEQWQGGDTDHRTDLYSAGLVFYEMLSGQQAHSGSDLTEIFVARTQHEAPQLADLDGLDRSLHRFDVVFESALARSKDNRFQSAAEMLEALEEADAAKRTTSRSTTRRRPNAAAKSGRRRTTNSSRRTAAPAASNGVSVDPRILAGVGVFVLLAVLWIAGVFDGSPTDPPNDNPNNGEQTATAKRTRAIPEDQRSDDDRAFLQRLDLAMASLRGGDLDTARREAGTATSLRQDAEALLVRAMVFRAEGDLLSARDDLEDAIQLDQNYAEAHAWLGLVAVDQNRRDDADKSATTALDLDAGCTVAICTSAAVQILDDRAEGALEDIEAALETSTDDGLLKLWAGEALLATDEPELAVDALRDAVRLEPQEIRGPLALARAYVTLDQTERAVQLLNRTISRTEAKEPRIALARILLESGSEREALEALEAMRSRLRTGDELMMLATAQFVNDETNACQRSIERALAASPSDPASLHRMSALIALDQERLEEALEAASNCVEADDTVASHWSILGLAQFRNDEINRAVFAFEQAFQLDASNTFVSYTLGVLYMDYVNNKDGAIECFTAYENAGGSDAKVRGFLDQLDG